MGFLLIILIIAAIYHFAVSKPKQRQLEEAEFESAKKTSFTLNALKNAMDLACAAQQIVRAGQCKVSALTIQITNVDGTFARLNMALTIYRIPTNPFYDLQMHVLIASGDKQPKYVNIPEEYVKRIKEAKDLILSNPAAYAEQLDKTRKFVEEKSYEAIYQALFGANQNYFNGPIDQYYLEITQYPVGDVTIKCDWNVLESGKHETYKKSFAYICSMLKENYADAIITMSECEIRVSF